MPLTITTLARQLEELNLLRCSLLAGEHLSFIQSSEHAATWAQLLQSYSDTLDVAPADLQPEGAAEELGPARFQVGVDGSQLWFEVHLAPAYDGTRIGEGLVSITMKGTNLGREQQARWTTIIQQSIDQLEDSGYPVYELLSTSLLPRLHAELDDVSNNSPGPPLPEASTSNVKKPRYHALLTSHHLKSPNKRRSLQQWSNQLSVTGFAKVGHPGVIYCEGEQSQVENFVTNVKAMQWLALRVRFIEPLPVMTSDASQGEMSGEDRRRWLEFEKVGEVIEEMRGLGREKYVVEMGIGSASTTSNPK